ncbi:TRAP transporter substrate-binding protein [Cardiobacteriaceae bacterium TAE3-ERU3]|nr:TRAP transporter substrate-binding protein [Cardiobacteriaceae bacterium TAE3-ERU3]
MNMKKSILAAALLATMTYANAETTIKFSHIVAPDTPKGQMAQKFKEIIEERSNGDIKVDIFPNSQLYNDNKVLEALLLGDVQMAAPSLSKLQRLTTKMQVYDLPFLFKDMDAVERFQSSEVGQELLKTVEPKGIVALGYLHNGLKQFSANDPIRVPADMDGKKFRIQQSDVLASQFEAVGAVPIKKPFSEVYTLLQTKAIDGAENPWSNIYSQKFHEIQPYITESNNGLLDYVVITSKSFMDSLPEDQQALVREAADEAIAYGNGLAAEINNRDKQSIIDSGYSEIIELTPEERKQWVDAMRPVWKQYEDQIGADVIAAAEASNEAQ